MFQQNILVSFLPWVFEFCSKRVTHSQDLLGSDGPMEGGVGQPTWKTLLS